MAADSTALPPYTVIDPDDRQAHPYYVSPVHIPQMRLLPACRSVAHLEETAMSLGAV